MAAASNTSSNEGSRRAQLSSTTPRCRGPSSARISSAVRWAVPCPALKNTFFYGIYEGLRQKIGHIRAERGAQRRHARGQFHRVRTCIYDPLSLDARRPRTPFPGDVIPQTRIDPIATQISGAIRAAAQQQRAAAKLSRCHAQPEPHRQRFGPHRPSVRQSEPAHRPLHASTAKHNRVAGIVPGAADLGAGARAAGGARDTPRVGRLAQRSAALLHATAHVRRAGERIPQ